jgi:hypothetical protein
LDSHAVLKQSALFFFFFYVSSSFFNRGVDSRKSTTVICFALSCNTTTVNFCFDIAIGIWSVSSLTDYFFSVFALIFFFFLISSGFSSTFFFLPKSKNGAIHVFHFPPRFSVYLVTKRGLLFYPIEKVTLRSVLQEKKKKTHKSTRRV